MRKHFNYLNLVMVYVFFTALAWVSFPSLVSASGWAKSYYLKDEVNLWPDSEVNSVLQTDDGGYILAGTVRAPKSYIWVSKLDSEGKVLWIKGFDEGEINSMKACCLRKTADGGYIVAGKFRIDKEDNWRDNMFVLKLDSEGKVAWQKAYGTPGPYFAYFENEASILQTKDGGYILASNTDSESICGSRICVLVLKLGAGGNITWQKAYGAYMGSALAIHCLQKAHKIVETPEGGYLLLAQNISNTALVKLNAAGNITWQKVYEVSDKSGKLNVLDSIALALVPTNEGKFLLAGRTVYRDNYDKPVPSVMWFMMVDGGGNPIWIKGYTDPVSGKGYTPVSIRQTKDGEYIVAGNRSDPYKKGYPPYDIFVIKLKADGTIRWKKIYAGYAGALNLNYDDQARSILETSDGGYILGGLTYNFSPDWGDSSAAWILKLDSEGNIPDCSVQSFTDHLQPTTDVKVTVENLEVSLKETNISARDYPASPFEPKVEEQEQCVANSKPSGDVSGDGEINVVDALFVARHVVGLSVSDFDASAADVNCDGEVNIVDALFIARKAVGLPVTGWCGD